MPLEKYKSKRDFNKTSEPEGKVLPSGELLHYTLQKHDARRLHYDLRLEWDGVLLSWAVPKGPSLNPRDKRLAVQVEDHPLDYRDFEGSIPAGEYGGGTVQLFDEGYWYPLGDVSEGLIKGELKFLLAGQRLKGQFVLVRLKPKPGEDDKNWLLIKEKDEWVKDDTGLEEFDTSVSSGRTLDQIAQGAEVKPRNPRPIKNSNPASTPDELREPLPFKQVGVMLATLEAKAPAGPGWRHEIKFDGYRLLAFLEDGKARLLTRNGLDWTAKFPAIVDSLEAWKAPGNLVVDGEVVVLDEEGRSDFQELQQAIQGQKGKQMRYMVFDLLALGAQDLRSLPLEKRQELLQACMEDAPALIQLSPWSEGDPSELFGKICEQDQEGLVSKRLGSVYVSGRSREWVKSKCARRQEFVVVAYTRSEKKRTGLSSLLLAVNTPKGLRYAGRVGTGFSNLEATELVKRFKPLVRDEAVLTVPTEYRPSETITWLEPETVVEVQFAELTDDGIVRQASYKGIREDKPVRAVTLENDEKDSSQDLNDRPEKRKALMPSSAKPRTGKAAKYSVAGVNISSPDKSIDAASGTTKADLVRYYEDIAALIMPHLEKRLLSLVRYPDGLAGEGFYMKHASGQIPGVQEAEILESDGDKASYMYIQDIQGLIGAVQMSTVEFHPWGSRIEALEKPDMLTFDLDPDQGLGLDQVRQGVRDLKSVLDSLNLKSLLKTSGGKGYHVVIPLKPNAQWEKARNFAENIAKLMEAKWPKSYTANMRKESRKGKIYIDWVRNTRGATSVAAYSLRARQGLPISWPIAWEDLDKFAPNRVNICNYQEYLAEEAWKNYPDIQNEIPA